MNTRRLAGSLLAQALGLVVMLALCVRAARSAGALQQELRTSQAALQSARDAESALDRFQREEAAFVQREQALLAAIPLNEQEPFGLVKQLTRVAEQAGATRLSVSLKPRVLTPQAASGSPAYPEGMVVVPIHMDFEIEFLPLLELLKHLRALPRVTAVEELRMTRAEATFPKQKVALVLNAYTLIPPSPSS